MKHLFLAFFLACFTAGIPAAELIDFARSKPAIGLHAAAAKEQSSRYDALPDGRNGLRIDWNHAKAGHFEFAVNQRLPLPEFTRVRIEVAAYLPPGDALRRFNLRLTDADNETFQIPLNIPAGMSGWQEFAYEIDADAPRAEIWGGSGNRKLNFPVRLNGFAGDFRRKDGTAWMGIGRVAVRVLDRPLEVELETGNPIHVLRRDETLAPALKLENSQSKPLSGKLEYRLTGTAGEPETRNGTDWTLQPGETLRLELPRPERDGVYYIDSRIVENDTGKITEKRMSYAYMTPAGPTPGLPTGFIFGVCSHPQRHSEAAQELEAMAAAWCGAKAVREDIGWERMQPEESRWVFRNFDRTVEIFGRYGIEIQAIYSYLPNWAVAADWKPASTARTGRGRPDYSHWAKFVRTFAERYRGKVRYVEVWNEPDLIGFANFSQPEYLELMKIAYRETKAAAPEMTVLTGGFTCMPNVHGSMNDPDHMLKTLRDGKGYYDIHAFHGHGPYSHYRRQIEPMMVMRRDLGVTAPWYANETAISSIHIGERIQAWTLFQKLLYSWARGAVGYNWYDLRNDGNDPRENEHNFGLITRDFHPKAAYVTYNMLANTFRNGGFLRDLPPGDGLEGFLFQDATGNYLLPQWNNRRNASVRLIAVGHDAKQTEAIDLFGNVRELVSAAGCSVIEVRPEPATVRFSGASKEPVILGELLRPQDEVSIVPGGKAATTFRLLNPSTRPEMFRLEFTLPDGVTAKQSSFDLRIAPGRAETVKLELEAAEAFRSLHGNMKHLALDLKAGSLWAGKLSFPLWTVARLKEGDFPVIPDFELRDASQLVMLAPNDPSRAHLFWRGPGDLSGKVFLARDGRNLKLRLEVTDDKHFQPFSGSDVWKGDNVQLALRIPGQSDFWEIGLTRLADGKSECVLWTAPKGFDPAQTANRISLETSRDEEKKLTVYEAAIPLEAIGLTEQAGKRGFRFNLLINDNDGEMRESFLSIAPGIGETKNADFFPVVSF